MFDSAVQIAQKTASLNGSERLLIVVPGRHGEAILGSLLQDTLRDSRHFHVVLDSSRQRLERAKPARSIQAQATRLPIKKHSFDAVLSFEALYAIRPPWTVLAEFHRVLVPDGKLILFEPAAHGMFSSIRDKLLGPGKRIFSLDEVKFRLGRADYEVEHVEECASVAGMQWPAYCLRALKRENPAEPVPQYMTAQEMMARRKKIPEGEELP